MALQTLKKFCCDGHALLTLSPSNQGKLSLFLFFSCLLLGLSPQAAASELREQLRDIENRVWMADSSDLASLETEVTRLIQEDPYSSFAHYLLGHVYLRQFKDRPTNMGQLRKASDLAQQALDLNTKSEFGYLLSAEILDLMGYGENAAKMLDPAVNPNIKESWRTLFVRAQLLAGHSNGDRLLTKVGRAMEMEESARPLIAPYVVAIIRSTVEPSEIYEQLESWNKTYPDEVFMQGMALVHAEKKQYKEAVEIYKKMIARYPSNLDAQINKGILAYVHLKQYDSGRLLLEKTLDDSKLVNTDKRSLVHSHLGRIYLEQGDLAEARTHFRQAIVEASGPFEWLSFTQESYLDKNQFGEFSKLLASLKVDIPGSALLYALHGEVLSEHLKDHDLAIRSYSDAILLDPDRTEYYNGLGLTYYRKKDMEGALAIFSQAARLNPRDAVVRYNEACMLAILGRKHEALGSLREAINLDPRLVQTAKQDQDLENIRESKQFEAIVGQGSPHYSQLP